MGHEEHRQEAPRSVRVFVVTASDTRGEAEDESGAFLREAAAAAGHALAGYRIVPDDPQAIRAALDAAASAGADAIIVNGGTGIAGARPDLRGGGVGPREAARRLRRALPDALLRPRSAPRRCSRARWPGSGAAAPSSRSRARRRRSAWPGRSSSARSWGTSCASCGRTPVLDPSQACHREPRARRGEPPRRVRSDAGPRAPPPDGERPAVLSTARTRYPARAPARVANRQSLRQLASPGAMRTG